MKIVSPVSLENTRHLQSQTLLLICDTGQVLLEWNSSNTIETMKAETKRPLMDWDPLTNSPESWHSGTKRMLLVPLCLRFSAYWAGCQIEGITCIFWLVEARESILKLVKNPSSQDLEQDENKTSFGLCFSSL